MQYILHFCSCDDNTLEKLWQFTFYIGLLYEFLVTFDSFTSSLQEDIWQVVQEDILHLFSPETMTLATVGFSYLQVNTRGGKIYNLSDQLYWTS